VEQTAYLADRKKTMVYHKWLKTEKDEAGVDPRQHLQRLQEPPHK
jgi:hypothetical protein